MLIEIAETTVLEHSMKTYEQANSLNARNRDFIESL